MQTHAHQKIFGLPPAVASTGAPPPHDLTGSQLEVPTAAEEATARGNISAQMPSHDLGNLLGDALGIPLSVSSDRDLRGFAQAHLVVEYIGKGVCLTVYIEDAEAAVELCTGDAFYDANGAYQS